MAADRWSDARRIEAWAGEVRVNLIRCIALVAFYGHHLLNVHFLADDETLRGAYHTRVTALVAAWTIAAVVLHYCLANRVMPPVLPYVTTLWDLTLITALLALGGVGPRSPLVVLYLVVIVAAPLRLSLGVVWFSTLGAMAAVTLLMGYFVYFQVGREAYYDSALSHRIARPAQVVFLLALGAAGLLAGQIVRQARRLVAGYPVAVVAEQETPR